MSNTNSNKKVLVEKSVSDQYVQTYTREILLNPDLDWGDLLSAAPRALVTLGEAFVAAASVTASKTIQVEVSNGLQYQSLRANLQHCVDLGQDAFLEAEAKMTSIGSMAKFVSQEGGSVDKILRLCKITSLAERELPRQIKQLKDMSSTCVNDTRVLQEKFETWGHLVQALQRACRQSDDTAKNSHTDLARDQEIKESCLVYQQQEIDAAQKRMKEQRKALEVHAKDMIEAQRKIPQGWNLVAIRAAEATMEGVGSFVEGAAASLAAVRNIVVAGGPTLNLKVKMESNGRSQLDEEQRVAEKKLARRKKRALEVARQNYIDSQNAYAKSQELYQTLADRDQEQKSKFNDIQLELQKLAQENVTIEEIMGVLDSCMTNLSEFNEHITKLRQFFNGVYTYVHSIDKTYVAEFIHGAEQLDRRDLDSEARTYYLENVRHDVLKVKGSYMMVGELAGNYVSISKKHIIPGIHLVNRLMLSDGRATSSENIGAKVKQINAYARSAQSDVSIIARNRRGKIESQLSEEDLMIQEAAQIIAQGEDALGAADDFGDGQEMYDDYEDDLDGNVWEDYDPEAE